jgi:hypothetical protein
MKALNRALAVGLTGAFLVAAATPSEARWRGGGALAAGAVIGLAAGAIAGSALAPRTYYGPGYGYGYYDTYAGGYSYEPAYAPAYTYAEPSYGYAAPAPVYVEPGYGYAAAPAYGYAPAYSYAPVRCRRGTDPDRMGQVC